MPYSIGADIGIFNSIPQFILDFVSITFRLVGLLVVMIPLREKVFFSLLGSDIVLGVNL